MSAAPNRFARPFIPLLLSLMGGIAIGVHRPAVLSVSLMHALAIFIAVGSAAGILACILHRKANRLLPLLLFAALGYLSIHPWSAPRFPDDHISHFADGPKLRIVGRLHNRPRQQTHRTRFILTVERLGDGKRTRPVSCLLRVTVGGGAVDLDRGDRIEINSRIRSIRNFNNPGAFDFKRYMAFQKVWATAYTAADTLRVLDRNSGPGVAAALDAVRNRVGALIDRTREGPQRDVLRALVLGDRSRIDTDLRESFHRSGVGHLLAISGLHIGIVAGSAFFILAAILSRFEVLLWYAWVKKAAAIGSFVPALLYALLAGMSPSTQRALAMVAMFLLTFLLEREQDSMNTLAVAAMLILLFHPPALFSVSFQLSFTAVFFIIFGLSRVQPTPGMGPVTAGRRLGRKLFAFLVVTTAATLGTLPLVMAVFQQVSLVAVFTNFGFVPLIGFGVVPLALLSVLALWVCPPAAAWGIQLAGELLAIGIKGIEFVATLPFAAVYSFVPSLFETLCYYLLLAGGLEIIHRYRGGGGGNAPLPPENAETAGERNNAQRPALFFLRGGLRWIAVVVALAAVGGLVDAGYWVYQRFFRNDLRVTIVDVGQGSAALLELPKGVCVLADGGGLSDNAVFDVGARVLAPLLRRKKIWTVDTLILSHPNSDHLNGLIYIAERFRVKQLWSNGERRETLGYRRLQEVLQRKDIAEIPYTRLPRENLIVGTRFQLLYPPVGFLEKKKTDPWRDANANSLVFKVGLGAVSFLFAGDISARSEKEMVSLVGDRLDAAVLIIPHHGSRTSSSPDLIAAVRPRVGIVSCGWHNRFGFPHPEVLQRFRQRQVYIYRTDAHGAITLITDGRELKITPRIGR